jgi:hypothetical protein
MSCKTLAATSAINPRKCNSEVISAETAEKKQKKIPPFTKSGGIFYLSRAGKTTKSSLYQFQIKDDLKAARIEAARRTEEYVEQQKTSQRREGLEMDLELEFFYYIALLLERLD